MGISTVGKKMSQNAQEIGSEIAPSTSRNEAIQSKINGLVAPVSAEIIEIYAGFVRIAVAFQDILSSMMRLGNLVKSSMESFGEVSEIERQAIIGNITYHALKNITKDNVLDKLRQDDFDKFSDFVNNNSIFIDDKLNPQIGTVEHVGITQGPSDVEQ